MKNIIAITSLLAAGTLLANAATAVQNEDSGWTLSGSGAEVNSLFSEILAGSDYQVGDAFSIDFKVTSSTFDGYTSGSVATLADSYYLFSQAGSYLGLSASTSNLRNASNVDPGAKAATSTDTTNLLHTITTNSGELAYGWVSLNTAGTGSNASGLINTQISISTDGANSVILLNFSNASVYDTKIELVGTVLDATKFAFSDKISAVDFTTSIPEPSAFGLLAGLGALALAGTRRRRAKKA
ncbi:PEP-CTERM sorting domain-containing protein [Candidatus Spyradosoma sp. SGI.093]|uniref:PEP-CTERM sorting domain-containing protein n=1 Tax=Candidatus Spyradosoma sp. SGI.093 TaxID=3420583 RepID=UPI003CFFE67A